MSRGVTGLTNVDFSVVAAIATEKHNQALREAGRDVPARPAYGPADVMYILAAAVEAGGTLRRERKKERDHHHPHHP